MVQELNRLCRHSKAIGFPACFGRQSSESARKRAAPTECQCGHEEAHQSRARIAEEVSNCVPLLELCMNGCQFQGRALQLLGRDKAAKVNETNAILLTGFSRETAVGVHSSFSKVLYF